MTTLEVGWKISKSFFGISFWKFLDVLTLCEFCLNPRCAPQQFDCIVQHFYYDQNFAHDSFCQVVAGMVREAGLLAHTEVTQLFPPLCPDVVSSLDLQRRTRVIDVTIRGAQQQHLLSSLAPGRAARDGEAAKCRAYGRAMAGHPEYHFRPLSFDTMGGFGSSASRLHS